MTRTIEEARKIGEERIGRKLEDKEFEELLAYARHKADCQGNGESYVPLLLPDVIYEDEYSRMTLKLYREQKEAMAELDRLFEKEDAICRLQSELARSLGVQIPRTTIESALSAISVCCARWT